jgi:hypothetical protein
MFTKMRNHLAELYAFLQGKALNAYLLLIWTLALPNRRPKLSCHQSLTT